MEQSLESKIFVAIIIISAILLIISIVKQRFDLLVNFALRIVAGLLAIYISNTLLQGFGLDLTVGLNALTALVVGVLGLPGFALLYGLAFFFMA
ncbi:MAG: transcriptional regulator [Clostridiales bacterium]|nr:transcriptional regulator [Clostridiales bacterium]